MSSAVNARNGAVIRASDDAETVSHDLIVKVERPNTAPVIDLLPDQVVMAAGAIYTANFLAWGPEDESIKMSFQTDPARFASAVEPGWITTR